MAIRDVETARKLAELSVSYMQAYRDLSGKLPIILGQKVYEVSTGGTVMIKTSDTSHDCCEVQLECSNGMVPTVSTDMIDIAELPWLRG